MLRDSHALFDGGLIAIDPESWTVQVAPELKRWPDLWALRGKTLAIGETLRPDSAYLRNHYDRFRSRWGLRLGRTSIIRQRLHDRCQSARGDASNPCLPSSHGIASHADDLAQLSGSQPEHPPV